MSLRVGLRVLLGLAASACDSGSGRVPPTENLSAAPDTLVAEWANLPVAVSLGGGRWAVVAPGWDAATIADFRARSLTPLGGPKQRAYLHPSALFAVGDTIYLADWGLRRTTVWSPDGRLLDSIPVADPLRGAFPHARDAAGQLYYEVTPLPRRDGSHNRDSAAIVRAPRSLARFDSVARLAPLDVMEMKRESSSRFERRVFSGTDLWGVWPDGTLWIARVGRAQIVSVDAQGRVTKGPELPDPVWEVTQSDRDRYLQGYTEDVRPKEADLPFALIFPPFTAAFAAPGQTIWLEKSKPMLDSARMIHVLDRAGHLIRVLQINGAARLIAVGGNALLLAEQFEKGVRLLQVRIPAAPRSVAGGSRNKGAGAR
jgi:hypothetical protein